MMTLATFNKLLTLYLLALINEEQKKKLPKTSDVTSKQYDKELKRIENELRKITRNKNLTIATLIVSVNSQINKQQKNILKQLTLNRKKYEKKIRAIVNIPNEALRIKQVSDMIKDINKAGMLKVPVKTRKGIQQWDSEKYYNRQVRNIQYNAYRDASILANKEVNNDIFKVIHRVNEAPRLGCAPYENQLLSYTRSSGFVKGEYVYNISDTSHGTGGGLFDNYCRHVPIPYFIGENNSYEEINLEVFM